MIDNNKKDKIIAMDDTPNYYYLKMGEITQAGDEVEVSNGFNDPPRWEPANVGEIAPDPQCPSHRQYRRLISPDATELLVRCRDLDAEIERLKECARREGADKTISLEMPSKENGNRFFITAPASCERDEHALVEEFLKPTLELLVGIIQANQNTECETRCQELEAKLKHYQSISPCPVCRRGDIWQEAISQAEYVFSDSEQGKNAIAYVVASVQEMLEMGEMK